MAFLTSGEQFHCLYPTDFVVPLQSWYSSLPCPSQPQSPCLHPPPSCMCLVIPPSQPHVPHHCAPLSCVRHVAVPLPPACAMLLCTPPSCTDLIVAPLPAACAMSLHLSWLCTSHCAHHIAAPSWTQVPHCHPFHSCTGNVATPLPATHTTFPHLLWA